MTERAPTAMTDVVWEATIRRADPTAPLNYRVQEWRDFMFDLKATIEARLAATRGAAPRFGPTLPAYAAVNDVFLLIPAQGPADFYVCRVENVWARVVFDFGGGGTPPSGGANSVLAAVGATADAALTALNTASDARTESSASPITVPDADQNSFLAFAVLDTGAALTVIRQQLSGINGRVGFEPAVGQDDVTRNIVVGGDLVAYKTYVSTGALPAVILNQPWEVS